MRHASPESSAVSRRIVIAAAVSSAGLLALGTNPASATPRPGPPKSAAPECLADSRKS